MKLFIPALILFAVIPLSAHSHPQDDTDKVYSARFGIAHKTYRIDQPFDATDGRERSNNVPVIAISLSERLNDHASVHIELAKGYSQANASYNYKAYVNLHRTQVSGDYSTKLDYSATAFVKLRLFGRKTFSPFVTLGMNSSAISYDFDNTDATAAKELDGKQTSSGASFGAGIELNVVKDADITLSYRKLPHHKEDVHVGSFEFGVSF